MMYKFNRVLGVCAFLFLVGSLNTGCASQAKDQPASADAAAPAAATTGDAAVEGVEKAGGSDAPMSAEHREQMAKMHEQMATCLRSGKPMPECQETMMQSCPMKGTGECPMVGRMHKHGHAHGKDKKGMDHGGMKGPGKGKGRGMKSKQKDAGSPAQ